MVTTFHTVPVALQAAPTDLVPLVGKTLVDWSPGAGLKRFCKSLAGLGGIAWVVYGLWSLLFPGNGARNPFVRMGMGRVLGAAVAILIFADISTLPKVVNTLYSWIIGIGILEMFGIK